MSDLRDQVAAAYEQSTTPLEEENAVKNTVVEEAPEIGASEDAPDSEDIQPDNEPKVDQEPNAPEHWAEEDKEVFSSLDTRGREFLLRRHKEMEAAHTKKQQAVAEERKRLEGLLKTVEPHDEFFNDIGLKREEALANILNVARVLHGHDPKSKAAVVQQIINDYNVQLGNQQDSEPLDPQTQLIFSEVNQLKENLRQLQQERIQNEERSLQNTINDFANQKDESGNLKYPHFETLKEDMGILMSARKAESLEEAYEAAIYLNRDLRKDYILRQNNKDKQEAEAREKTAASKRASFNLKSGSTTNIIDPKPDLSLRDEIRRNVESGYRI